MATRSKKPKCNGSTSQSCGMGCISREDTCREQIAADVASRLVSVATRYKQANDAPGSSFDAVMSQFPPKLLKEAHKTGVATSDLGDGAALTTKEAIGLDGSTIKYGFVTDSDGKRYTVSDGLVKEVTSAAGTEWQEAFEAAVRSKIAKQDTFDSAIKSATDGEVVGIEPFKVTKLLGRGGYGKAELTDRGTVVKTMTTDRFLNTDLGNKLLQQEYNGLEAMYKSGLGAKPIGLDKENGMIEMQFVKGETLQSLEDSGDDRLEEVYSKIGKAMYKLHRDGYTHNDLHGGNIMLSDGEIKFIDAGFVGKVGEVLVSSSLVKEAIPARSGLNDLSYGDEDIASRVTDRLKENGSIDRFKLSKDYRTATLEKSAKAELELHNEYLKVLDELGL